MSNDDYFIHNNLKMKLYDSQKCKEYDGLQKPVGNYRLTSQSNHYLYAVELSLVDALSISI